MYSDVFFVVCLHSQQCDIRAYLCSWTFDICRVHSKLLPVRWDTMLQSIWTHVDGFLFIMVILELTNNISQLSSLLSGYRKWMDIWNSVFQLLKVSPECLYHHNLTMLVLLICWHCSSWHWDCYINVCYGEFNVTPIGFFVHWWLNYFVLVCIH